MARLHNISQNRVTCVALRDEGLSASQIALRIGITRNAVIGHWWRANGSVRLVGPRLYKAGLTNPSSILLRLESEEGQKLFDEAKQRGISPTMLCRKLIFYAIRDSMVSAILDEDA